MWKLLQNKAGGFPGNFFDIPENFHVFLNYYLLLIVYLQKNTKQKLFMIASFFIQEQLPRWPLERIFPVISLFQLLVHLSILRQINARNLRWLRICSNTVYLPGVQYKNKIWIYYSFDHHYEFLFWFLRSAYRAFNTLFRGHEILNNDQTYNYQCLSKT